jgi:hypothetical protein
LKTKGSFPRSCPSFVRARVRTLPKCRPSLNQVRRMPSLLRVVFRALPASLSWPLTWAGYNAHRNATKPLFS